MAYLSRFRGLPVGFERNEQTTAKHAITFRDLLFLRKHRVAGPAESSYIYSHSKTRRGLYRSVVYTVTYIYASNILDLEC